MFKLTKAKTILIGAGALLALLAALFFGTTGFYVIVPTYKPGTDTIYTPGMTVWFVRRQTPLKAFVSSADGLAIQQGYSPTPAIRKKLDDEFARITAHKTIHRFGFSRRFYLMTTDNVDLYSPEGDKTGTEATPSAK
jgi:hypothetical protein